MTVNTDIHVCPDCGAAYPCGRSLGQHKRWVHGIKLPKKSPPKRKHITETADKSKDPLWDPIGERWITPCPQCQQPRTLINFYNESTTLVCNNWPCPLFKRPLENKLRVVHQSVPIQEEGRAEETSDDL